MDKGNKLYVAYGSNLHIGQMAHRCPTAKVVGASWLNGQRLLFRGGHGGAVATVEPHKGGKVPVLAWEITPTDELALDRYDGFPYLYRKEKVKINLDGKRRTAMVYVMNTEGRGGEHRPLNQPGAGYYTTILDGYKVAGFDVDILRQATEDSVETNGASLTEEIMDDIEKVRSSGACNMLDITAVQRYAHDNKMYSLVIYLEENKKKYINYTLYGTEQPREV